jgi:hypothetical protein
VLYGLRYLEGRDDANTAELKRFVEHDLHYLDYRDTLAWYPEPAVWHPSSAGEVRGGGGALQARVGDPRNSAWCE